MLTSYDARRINDGQGNTMFSEVVITTQDLDLLDAWTKDIAERLPSILPEVVVSSTMGDNALIIDARKVVIGETMIQLLAEYITARWLSDKSQDRAAFHEKVYQELIDNIRLMAVKQKPTFKA